MEITFDSGLSNQAKVALLEGIFLNKLKNSMILWYKHTKQDFK